MAIPAEKTATEKAEKTIEKRRALGRGLESLLPGPRAVPMAGTEPGAARAVETVPAGAEPASASAENLQAMAARRPDGIPIVEVPLDAIDDNPHQTRSTFDESLLQELAQSIKVQGVIQPIMVRPATGAEGRYVLVLGERRLRASKLAGKTTIPAIIKRVSEQQAAEMTLIENLQRQDLDCLDQAEAFANLSQEFGLTQEEIGKRVGAARETVSNYLRLLKLPEKVKFLLQRGELSYSHARALLTLRDPEQTEKMAELAVRKKWSVLQLDDEVTNLNIPVERTPDGVQNRARWVDPNVRAAQRSLETILGTRVRIRDRRGKGKITIEYGTLEDFDRVVGMLKGK